MPQLEIVEGIPEALEQLRGEIGAALVAYNTAQAGPANHRPFAIAARDDRGRLVGGLSGSTAWQWLYVELLWVAESRRGEGVGTYLLRTAENLALERGCLYACVDTFDFQARGFYEREGYVVFGVKEDCPPGHRQFYLRKTIGTRDESSR